MVRLGQRKRSLVPAAPTSHKNELLITFADGRMLTAVPGSDRYHQKVDDANSELAISESAEKSSRKGAKLLEKIIREIVAIHVFSVEPLVLN